MAEREPAPVRGTTPRRDRSCEPPRRMTPMPNARREAPTVHVVGFWKRAVAAVVDLAIVIPVALLITLDRQQDRRDPSAAEQPQVARRRSVDRSRRSRPIRRSLMGLVLFVAIGLTTCSCSRSSLGRTLGMRVLKIKHHRRLRRPPVARALRRPLCRLPRRRRDAVPRVPVDGLRQREARPAGLDRRDLRDPGMRRRCPRD